MQRDVAYKKLNQQVSISIEHGKNRQNKRSGQPDCLSNKRQKFDVILMICACCFGLRPLLEVISYRLLSFWGHTGCPLSGVERCPFLGCSKCTISIGRAMGGMEFVCCTEVVSLSESPLLEVSLYIIL